MRRLTAKDGIAATILAAILTPYIGYVIRGDMPFIQDARGMAGVGLIGLLVAFAVWGLRLDTAFGKVTAALGTAALGVGAAAALVGSEGSDVVLAVFIAAIAVVWAAETIFDAGLLSRH